ncbi:TetR/AcrR family transcriptional regulator [Streptomyces sp. SAJ15]|uniref:TetR/AcrR family transcriptional regulator n=1 Tax=Streptomyces sp. SAJ15 TaxID=2011095 RepID=UPI0011869AFF|nr:TetR family transcriptional regulator [Streptomyces sp. SAJ15]TVL90769.1 TetR family transcriptional regulator [Streptomyces sp. SAJ15]
MPRRYDPDRRQRLIDAAIRVVDRSGIDGLSHRAVAAEADVPLGSTTYHFAGLDELLVAALRQVNEEWLADLRRRAEALDPTRPLADALAELTGGLLHGDRARPRLEYELHLAALRRDAVRPIAAECLDEMARILAPHTATPATARAVVALLDGLILQALLTDRPYDRDAARSALAALLG